MSNNKSIIGTNGSIVIGDITVYQGKSGPAGYQITDWKEDMIRKYPRFNIKTKYDDMTFTPIHVVIDNNTNKEYKINHTNQNPITTSNIMNETEQFIQRLIIIIREDKINTIINDSES